MQCHREQSEDYVVGFTATIGLLLPARPVRRASHSCALGNSIRHIELILLARTDFWCRCWVLPTASWQAVTNEPISSVIVRYYLRALLSAMVRLCCSARRNTNNGGKIIEPLRN